MRINSVAQWEEYCRAELALLTPLLDKYGYTLAKEQPHLGGERYLMQAVTTKSGLKLILYGERYCGTKVVLKATRESGGQAEIIHERHCRNMLARIDFATWVFHTPAELDFITKQGFVILVQQYIEQPMSFIKRPFKEQFSYALAAFKAQEGTHATTTNHFRLIKKSYELRNAATYLRYFTAFSEQASIIMPELTELHNCYQKTEAGLKEGGVTIDRYGNFLTHTDFVPHNFRIDTNGSMYLLDHSSLTFGNKYEGWARFLNFMTLYNPALEAALTKYVSDNRSAGEVKALHLMRLYRLGEIICYYLNTLNRSEGDLKTLNRTRVDFWAAVFACRFDGVPVPDDAIKNFKAIRDRLRSETEKKRQQKLH